MQTPFIAMICPFAFNFNPRGWAKCNGQLMSISQNDALFALIGTTYGGDGITTFGIPDLRGRLPIHQGTGPGLSDKVIGQSAGVESVTLNVNQMPAHNHNMNVNNSAATIAVPTNGANYFAAPKDVNKDNAYMYTSATPNTTIAASTLLNSGGNQPHNNIQPYLTVNFCIALEGVFPSRN